MNRAAVAVGPGSVAILDNAKDDDAWRVRYLRLVRREFGGRNVWELRRKIFLFSSLLLFAKPEAILAQSNYWNGKLDEISGLPLALPDADENRWIADGDYPKSVQSKKPTELVAFTMHLDNNGKVVGCVIRESSGNAELDRATCDLIRRRGKFRPARNAAGNAVAGAWSRRVLWVVPDASKIHPELGHSGFFMEQATLPVNQADYPPEALRLKLEGNVSTELDVAADGHPTACRILYGSGYSVLDNRTCEIWLARMRFSPARDEQGNPAASTIKMPTLKWKLEK